MLTTAQEHLKPKDRQSWKIFPGVENLSDNGMLFAPTLFRKTLLIVMSYFLKSPFFKILYDFFKDQLRLKSFSKCVHFDSIKFNINGLWSGDAF